MSSSHSAMAASVSHAFAATFGDQDDVAVVMAPGRVNLLGEHTDYNEGYVFPMTLDRGVYFAIRKRADHKVRIASMRFDERVEYDLGDFETPTPGSWKSYVLGVVEEFRRRGCLDHGFEAVFDGNLDLGTGLSSSAALEVATALSVQHVAGFRMDPVEMVKLCQHVEHEYAHVMCGIMDQFACGIGRSGHALLLDCRSLAYEHVPVELGDYRVVIISSEVRRALVESAYNTRRAECQAGVELLRRYDDSVESLRDVGADLFEAHHNEMPDAVRRRCRHVLSENRRVLEAAAALKSGALDRLGELMTASHRSMRDDFEISCPQLDLLVELANSTAGVLGSRMTGGGFGGCTVSIMNDAAIAQMGNKLAEYEARFNLTPRVFVLHGNLEAGAVLLQYAERQRKPSGGILCI
ncbi:MAG: galactokinase [Woeseiaceae bacterium]